MKNISKILEEFYKKFEYLYPDDSTIFQGQGDFLKQKLTEVIDDMVGEERKKEADNSEAAFSWNMAVVGFNQSISEQRAKAEDLKK